MLKICDVFIKKFINNEVMTSDPDANMHEETSEVDVIRHKK